ncbi:bifunctional NOT4 [Babesia duncani]|uniref:Bifunctional NOT4 n=1 Tax=Babesia duncani TaxID=323732 RepID=A0AAD9UPQ2_9APIC|nr:bifunctional NOT4 [Babesia duncani]
MALVSVSFDNWHCLVKMAESNLDISDDENEDELVCPLCMEVLDETDRNMYPCTCGYQVCLWCLHYIRNTMGNKCPACRRDYDEENIKYKSKPRSAAGGTCSTRPSGEAKKKLSGEKDATTREGKPQVVDPSQAESLKDVRVIQRNLVYVVGIPARFAKKEVLRRQEYFGQYGKIQHMAINKSLTYNSHWGGPSFTAYITYSKKSEASAAISGIDGSQLDNKLLKASYGTTKYCSYFLKGAKCCNIDCFYLHQFGDERDRFNKENSAAIRHQATAISNGEQKHHDEARTKKFEQKQRREQLQPATQGGYSTTQREPDIATLAKMASGLKIQASRMPSDFGLFVQSKHPFEKGDLTHLENAQYLSHFGKSYQGTRMNIPQMTDSSNSDSSAFRKPIYVELEQYNKGEPMFYVQENVYDCGIGPNASIKCIKWHRVNESTFSSKVPESLRSRQELDYYNTVNKIATRSNTRDGNLSTLQDFISSDSEIADVVAQIKRHWILLDNLSKQYTSTRVPNQNQEPKQIEQSLNPESFEVSSDDTLDPEDSQVDEATFKILCCDTIDESQIHEQEEIYNRLYQQSRDLLEYHEKRRDDLRRYMELLYDTSW